MSQHRPANPTDQVLQATLDQAVKMHQQGKLAEAWQLYQAVLKQNPNHPVALNLVGVLAKQMGQLELAEKMLRQATKIMPNYGEAHYNFGKLLQQDGRLDQAEAAYLKAIKANSKDVKARENLGLVLESLGRKKEAEQTYQEIIDIDPSNAGAYRNLARSGYDFGQEGLEKMLNLIKGGALTTQQQASLNFAIATTYDRMGEVDEAFKHLKEGNTQHRSGYQFDIEALRTELMGLQEQVASQLKKQPLGGSESTKPVFILGMPRSGTTLVEQIITSHPEASGVGESKALQQTIQHMSQLKNASFTQSLGSCSASDYKTLGDFYVRCIEAKAGKDAKRITDKMPDNYRFLGLAALYLPNAKIIHTTRSPMDTCWSIYRSYFNEGHPYAYQLEELGKMYRLYHELMMRWMELLPGRIYEMNYERLVKNLEEETRGLIDHIGLGWNECCLEFYKNTRAVQTNSNLQVRQPIYSSSIDGWKKYESHLQPLKEILGDLV